MRHVSILHRIRRKIRENNPSIHPRNPRYKWWVLLNVMIGTFMAVLDSTVVNVALPKLMTSFGASIDKMEWIITAYMLSMAVMLPTAGWLADKFGYKRIYFFGVLLFTAGSFLCGISPNENLLILSRIIQGIGGGALMPIGMAIVTRVFPREQRGTALGFWSIAAAASVSFGPLIGGFIIDKLSWHYIFYINIPIGFISLFATTIIQNEYKNKDSKRFDLLGFISVIFFLPFLTYALSESTAQTNTLGWSSPVVLACLGISTIAFAVFITRELTTNYPLVDLRLLKNYNFAIAIFMIFIVNIGMMGSTFLMPLYLQNSMGYTALQAGAFFLPIGILQSISSPTSGIIADKINAKIPIVTGLVIMSLSFFLNSNLSYLSEKGIITISLVLRGFALGMIYTPLSTLSMFDVQREKMAQASGMYNVVSRLGGSFGVAILATILTIRVNFHLQTYIQSINVNSPEFRSIFAGFRNFMQTTAGYSSSNATILGQSAIMSQVSKEAYISGINDDFFIAGMMSLVGIIPILFLKSKKKMVGK